MRDYAYIGGRSEINIKCVVMTISGERTEQVDIFCCVTGYTSDFLSFIDVELIRFFHGALQFFWQGCIDGNTGVGLLFSDR